MILAPMASKNTTIKGAEMLLIIPATKSKPKQTLLALIDSGTSACLISHNTLYKHITQKTREKTTWLTQGGRSKNL